PRLGQAAPPRRLTRAHRRLPAAERRPGIRAASWEGSGGGEALLVPVAEAGVGQARAGGGEERTLARVDAEVARLRIGDDLARVAGRRQHAADELVEPERLGPGDLHDSVDRLTDRHAADAGRDVVGGHRLDERRREADEVAL